MQKEVDIWTKYTRDGKGWSFIPNVLEVIKKSLNNGMLANSGVDVFYTLP